MENKTVLYEKHDRVAKVILNRPRYKNAQSRQLLDEMDSAFAEANADDDVRVIVLSGAGDNFSSGHDLGTPEKKRTRRDARFPRVCAANTRARAICSLTTRCDGATWTSRLSRKSRDCAFSADGCSPRRWI